MLDFTSSKGLLAFATFSVLAGLLVLPRYYAARPTVAASLYPLGVKVGEPVAFVDSTADAVRWQWEFGNQHRETAARGNYAYASPGTYLVRLTATTKANRHYSRTFQVQVRPNPSLPSLRIVGPASCYQEEQVVFRTTGGQPVQFRWDPGNAAAGARIVRNEPVAIFSYKVPGTYTVTLHVVQQESQPLRWDSLTQQIQVKAPIWVAQRQATARALADSLTTVSDFRLQLQRLANGYPFNAPYRFLLATYLAQQPPAAVLANGVPQRDFYSYCMSLHLVKGWQIDSVAVSRKLSTGRVIKLSVVQHKLP